MISTITKAMKRLLWLAPFAVTMTLGAQSTGTFPNLYCIAGAGQAVVSGQRSSNYQQIIIPYCTVTVYLTGTTTKATIYSDATNTPLTNPFQTSQSGQVTMYAAIDQGYDIVLSGGIPPNTYSLPVALIDMFPSGSIAPGGVVDAFTFPGSSPAEKTQNAINYAIANDLTLVDMAGFNSATGIVPFFGSYQKPLEIGFLSAGHTSTVTLINSGSGQYRVDLDTSSLNLPVPTGTTIVGNTGATSLATVTSPSGGTIVGASGSSVLLTGFNNGLRSNGRAICVLASSNTLSGATCTVLIPSDSATSPPTTATISSGSAVGSGTASVTTTLAAGTFPAGTYNFKINYRTGGGVGPATTRTTVTLASPGMFTFTAPNCLTDTLWARSYDVNISTGSDAETMQLNGDCDPVAGSTLVRSIPISPDGASNNGLFLGMPQAPTTANGIPAFIVHADTNSGFVAAVQSGKGLVLDAGQGMYVSNIIAVTGKGTGGANLGGIFTHANYPATHSVVTESSIYDTGSFTPSFRGVLYVFASPNAIGYHISGTLNDVKYENLTVNCQGQYGCTPFRAEYSPVEGDTSDSVHNDNFVHLNLLNPGCSESRQMYAAEFISPYGYNGTSKVNGNYIAELSLEMSSSTYCTTYPVKGIHLQNISGLTISSMRTQGNGGAVSPGKSPLNVFVIDDNLRPDGTTYTNLINTPNYIAGAALTCVQNNIDGSQLAVQSQTCRPYQYPSSGDSAAVQSNMVPDALFAFSPSPWTLVDGGGPGTVAIQSTGGANGLGSIAYTGTGSASAVNGRAYSGTMNVTAGTSYTLSANIDATQVTAGVGAGIQLVDADAGFTTVANTTVRQVNGSRGGISEVVTIPMGVSHVAFAYTFGSLTVTNAQKILYDTPCMSTVTNAQAICVPSILPASGSQIPGANITAATNAAVGTMKGDGTTLSCTAGTCSSVIASSPFWSTYTSGSGTYTTTANALRVFAFTLPAQTTFKQIMVRTGATTDNVNATSFGIYAITGSPSGVGAAGTLLAGTTAGGFASTATTYQLPLTVGSLLSGGSAILPGGYYAFVTGSASGTQIFLSVSSIGSLICNNTSATVPTLGQVPSSITIPAASINQQCTAAPSFAFTQ